MNTIEILLSTYNGEKYLEEQLISIINQSNNNWYLTIRDDGSSDSTIYIINSYLSTYPDKIKLYKDSNLRLGSTLSFSELIKQSTGSYIMLCDQDDFWLPNKIEDSYKLLQKKESQYPDMPLMVFSDMKITDEKLDIIADSFIENQKLYTSIISDYSKLIALNVVAGCTIIFNRQSIKHILPINSARIIHDQWIAVNIAKFGKIIYLDEQTSLYRQHKKNTVGAHNKNIIYFLSKLKTPIHQILIYNDLIKDLSFKINIIKFIYFKIFFTTLRLLNLKY